MSKEYILGDLVWTIYDYRAVECRVIRKQKDEEERTVTIRYEVALGKEVKRARAVVERYGHQMFETKKLLLASL